MNVVFVFLFVFMFVTLKLRLQPYRRRKLKKCKPTRNPHTHPTWLVFLFCICYLRCIPNKLDGLAALGLSVTVLYLFTYGSSSLFFFRSYFYLRISLNSLILLEIKTFLILFFISISTHFDLLVVDQDLGQ